MKRLPLPHSIKQQRARERRAGQIAVLRDRGYSLREIGTALGISAQRVHQLLTRAT